MYDKQVLIPAADDSTVIPDVEGEAFQVIRLSFDGSQDPAGNPSIVSEAGRIDVRMTEGDPVEAPFDGLEVHNKSDRAAGSVAILRIYEDAGNVRQHGRREVRQKRAYGQPEVKQYENERDISANATLTDGGNKFQVVETGGAKVERIEGLTIQISDKSLSTGVTGRIFIELGFNPDLREFSEGEPLKTGTLIRTGNEVSSRIRARDITVGMGDDIAMTLLKNQLVAPSQFVDIAVDLDGDDASELVTVKVEALTTLDLTAQFPPR